MPIEAVIDDQPVEATEVEEVTEDATEEAATEENTEESAQPTVEDIAKDLGWKSQDEFQGNDETYVDPATYIRRSKDIQQSMSQHLKDNRRKMDQMERGISDLHNHYEQVSKAQIAKQQKEIVRLRKEKREAIEEGDADRVDEIESEMLDKYDSMDASQPIPAMPEPDPRDVDEFDGWRSKNDWYKVKGGDGDQDMTAYADKLANLPEYDALPYQRKLATVTELVKKAFPDKFQGTAQSRPTSNSVEAPRGAPGKRVFSKRDLSSDQQSIMSNFVKRGIMTEKQYIADLAEIGELR
jgi:hypothetical protein